MSTPRGSVSRLLGTLATGVLAGACGSGDDTGPAQATAIAKAPTKSGDLQVGTVGQALPSALRVVVTQDGAPAPDVIVTWSTTTGTMAPEGGKTDANGVSASTWTLGDAPGTQTALASLADATGSPVSFTATATAETPPPTGPVIQVLGPEGGNRFSPAALTVEVGTQVTWEWSAGAQGHNVVPDDGVTPAPSGALADGPHVYSYTFSTPGTYRYHCQAHGASGGAGMSGTVTVATPAP